MELELPRWYDLHAHFRQGPVMEALVRDHLAMGCAGIVAMPNTSPPVSKVLLSTPIEGWSIEEYIQMLKKAGGDQFSEIIVPLYLTKDTTPKMIEEGAKSGILKACKYYPPHGTTGAQHGIPFTSFIDNGVFKAMENAGVILCIHGEEHGMAPEDYFARANSAEEVFYKERLPHALDECPDLKVVCEHVTTKAAVDFVTKAPATVAATITPQHLMYTAGHLLKGFKYHLYCLPLLKFKEDRAALRSTVTNKNNTKFFAGTDSAPHTNKITPCGCAAGCYTGGIAPQLYAEAFEMAGADLTSEDDKKAFEKFLCLNGPAFYDLPIPKETFTLVRKTQEVSALKAGDGSIVPLPLGMSEKNEETVLIPWSIA
jgi:dihydroorotase